MFSGKYLKQYSVAVVLIATVLHCTLIPWNCMVFDQVISVLVQHICYGPFNEMKEIIFRFIQVLIVLVDALELCY